MSTQQNIVNSICVTFATSNLTPSGIHLSPTAVASGKRNSHFKIPESVWVSHLSLFKIPLSVWDENFPWVSHYVWEIWKQYWHPLMKCNQLIFKSTCKSLKCLTTFPNIKWVLWGFDDDEVPRNDDLDVNRLSGWAPVIFDALYSTAYHTIHAIRRGRRQKRGCCNRWTNEECMM